MITRKRRVFHASLKLQVVRRIKEQGHSVQNVRKTTNICHTANIVLNKTASRALENRSPPRKKNLAIGVGQSATTPKRYHRKTGIGLRCPRNEMIYTVIRQLQKEAFPVQQSCDLLAVSRSDFYAAQHLAAKPASCKANIHLKAAFMASHQSCRSR